VVLPVAIEHVCNSPMKNNAVKMVTTRGNKENASCKKGKNMLK